MKRIFQLVAMTFVLIACGSGMPQPAQAAEESPWVLVQQAGEGDIIELPENYDIFYVVQPYTRQNESYGDAGCQIAAFKVVSDNPREFYPRFMEAQYIPYTTNSHGFYTNRRAKLVCMNQASNVTPRIDVYIEK